MLMAVLGDIDGDATALAAALNDIDEKGIHTVVHVGGMVGAQSQPNEAIDLLRTRRIPSIQGTRDRLVAQFLRKQKSFRAEMPAADFDQLQKIYDAVHCANIEFLQGLPRKHEFVVDGFSVYLSGCEAMALDPDFDGADPGRLHRLREQANSDIVVVGGTRHTFSAFLGNTLIAAPGSLRTEPGAAQWIQISTEEEPWTAAVCRVSLA